MIDINKIANELKKREKDYYELEGQGKIVLKDDGKMPYLLYIPDELSDKERLIVESNNCEYNKNEFVMNQAVSTLLKNNSILKGTAPIVVPIIPSYPNRPYYQQLSRDSFYEENPLHIEEEVSNIIKESIDTIEKEKGVKLDDKVFMNGYSASGVFAQRFALFHPEQIDTLVVGGASGSIPVPTSKIEYPLGIGGINNFDGDSYSKIKFRYYVSEYETVNLAKNRCEVVNGKVIDIPMPMHDMTYFPRSVNPYTGKAYRDYFGENYFNRVDKVIGLYKELGLDIKHTKVNGRAHKSMMIGDTFFEGINALMDPIVDNAYQESVSTLSEVKSR